MPQTRNPGINTVKGNYWNFTEGKELQMNAFT